MTILHVPDIRSSLCVDRIHNALSEAGLICEITEESKTVSIEGGRPAVSLAIEKLDNLGYDSVVLRRPK